MLASRGVDGSTAPSIPLEPIRLTAKLPTSPITMSTVETITQAVPSLTLRNKSDETEPTKKEEPYKYAHLLPVFDKDEHYPPLTPFEHVDPGHRALAHPNPRAFLDSATSLIDITPRLGTEVRGVNLVDLDNDGRDQLALEVARRGLVVFLGRHFGRLHIHPTSGHPAGLPELHLVYRDANTTYNFEQDERITSTTWHSDVSYELQPPGLTTFFLFSQPKTGGDTIFTSQVSTLSRLSPQFVAFLKTLKAVHSGFEQADYSRSGRRGGVVRREPVQNVHPVVRKHPVTGDEALYVNRQFTRRIVGLKREESDAILNFLYDHIDKSIDNQARIKWQPNTVVLWDNRVTAHSAIIDFEKSNERRHGGRITPQAERPIPALDGLEL
ncbi:TauD-domain-containing protein [Trametes gibbosa]|nr:TauD-domain-containing protein [Trametes gibbosa]KAI0828291.1 TauD-domain-containing protein [Trametes gibbosa]